MFNPRSQGQGDVVKQRQATFSFVKNINLKSKLQANWLTAKAWKYLSFFA